MWLKCLIIRVSVVVMVGIPQARLSLCVHVLVHVCVALSPQQNRKRVRDCDLICVSTIHTHPPPQETAVADKRSKGDSSIYPSTHPSILYSPPWAEAPLSGPGAPQLGQRGSGQPASLPGNQSKWMSVGTSSWTGMVAGRGPPGEYS